MDKPQLLIVEDNTDLSDMLNAYFRVQNYDVLVANWGEEAIRLSQENPIDLVVLDIRLPDIDGYEVCRQLRQNRRTQDVPIIFLTEKRERVDKLQGLELGVVDYITKPFDIQELRLRVRNAINRANRQAMLNPVTDLPEGAVVEEKLSALLLSDDRWAVLQLAIDNLTEFRELYGFVAADEVMRVITLLVRNALREHGSEDDFVGHISPEVLVVITAQDIAERVKKRLESRIEQSREIFYPLRDREKARKAAEENLLRLVAGILSYADGPFISLDRLKDGLRDCMNPQR